MPVYAAPPAPVMPETLPCSVELKPGLIIGKGCKTETLLTALKRRADYYAELEAMTPEQRAEHDAGIAEFKAMLEGNNSAAMQLFGNSEQLNSPVTPDGWISCSERMPDNDESKPIAIFTGNCLGQGMFVATYDDDGFFDFWEGMEIIGVTHWIPLPEPPQEVNHG